MYLKGIPIIFSTLATHSTANVQPTLFLEPLLFLFLWERGGTTIAIRIVKNSKVPMYNRDLF